MSDRYLRKLRLVAPIVPFLIATAVVMIKLPLDAVYAGADNGFANFSPSRHIFDAVWYSWSWFASGVSGGVGSVNLYNLLVTPYYVPFSLLQLTHLPPNLTSHGLEIFKYGLMGFGPYLLAATILGTATRKDILTSLCVGLFAMFNALTALWLLQPASQFQLTFGLWPCIIAWEIRLLRERRSLWEIVAFIALMYYALSFNPAHTICGWLLMIGVAVWEAKVTHTTREITRVGLLTAGALFLFTMPFWLSILVYHAVGATPLISSSNLAATGALIDHVRISNTLSSFAGLFHLNTVVWWPTIDRSKVFENPLMILANLALAALAVAGIVNRGFDASTRRFWTAVWLIALFLSKGFHAPLGDYYGWFISLPGADMFRESNDKFILIAYVAMIVLSAIGLRAVSRPTTQALVALALAISAIPFVFGQPYLEKFVVRVPPDYEHVAALLARDPDSRVLSFAPSDLNEQGSAYWFHGGNLDTTYFRNPVTYATTFQALGLSAAPLYGDDRLVSAQEFFADRQLGRILGIRYVLVHKDFTENLDVGYERESLRVNGSAISQALILQCKRDPQLERIYDGSHLALYRVRTADAPLTAVGHLHAVRGYGNALFPVLEMEPGNRGFVFSGTQADDIASDVPRGAYADKVGGVVSAPNGRLTTDQVLSSPDLEERIARSFATLRIPRTDVGSMPPGDIVAGTRTSEILSVKFPPRPSGRYDLTTFYRHVPGYSADEANELRFVPGTVVPTTRDAVGLNPDILKIVESSDVASASAAENAPLATGLHMFVAIMAAPRVLNDSSALKLSVDGPGGAASLWILAGFSPLGVERGGAPSFESLEDLLRLDHSQEPALGSVNLDLDSVLDGVLDTDAGRRLLYRPGLKIVRATLFLKSSADDGQMPRAAAMRLYNANESDYQAQDELVSATAPEKLALLQATGSLASPIARYRVDRARGAPSALALAANRVADGQSVQATYRYDRWVPNQLVLRAFVRSAQTDAYSATIDYTYRGRQFQVSGPATDQPDRVPFDVRPLTLDDLDALDGEKLDWRQLTIDLRGLLPDIAHSVVHRVTITQPFSNASSERAWFVFGALEGLRNDQKNIPLTGLIANGRLARPADVLQEGFDARVGFGRIAVATPQTLVVSTAQLQGNVPHAVRLGPVLASNDPVATGTLLDPTVGAISLRSSGIVELATMYNKAWVIRRGSVRAPGGPVAALAAWLSTKPQAAPHFVVEGFANAWDVPAGDYTLIFLPQVARDISLLAVGPIFGLWLLAALLLHLMKRART